MLLFEVTFAHDRHSAAFEVRARDYEEAESRAREKLVKFLRALERFSELLEWQMKDIKHIAPRYY
jgi:hypothetical protein